MSLKSADIPLIFWCLYTCAVAWKVVTVLKVDKIRVLEKIYMLGKSKFDCQGRVMLCVTFNVGANSDTFASSGHKH
jgi:hypothetical protein